MKKIFIAFIFLSVCGCESIFEDDLSNDSVTLLAPLNNAQLTSGDITFSWQFVDNADSYQIQIATPNFESATQILLDSITGANEVTHNLDVGTYQWRVKAVNSAYETSYNTVNFEIN